MGNTISHTKASTYQTCPMSYKYYYIDKLRQKTQSSALAFGSAIDKSIEHILLNPKADHVAFFEKEWRFQDINGTMTYLPTFEDLSYSESDFDAELITEEALDKLEHGNDSKVLLERLSEISLEKKSLGWNKLSKEDRQLYNHANWWSLHQKGLLILQAFRNKVLPNITKIHATQAPISLSNDDGDSIVGFADLVCNWRGVDVPVVLDFKTSSKPYEADAVKTSTQLASYTHGLYGQYKTRKAGFVVFSKHIKKIRNKVCTKCGYKNEGTNHKTCNKQTGADRCDGIWDVSTTYDVYIQTLIDDVNESMEDLVMENMDALNSAIKANQFYRNFNSCKTGYGLCKYYEVCYNNSFKGLIKLDAGA